MARIRSIHPGIFTDEIFVTLSMPARVLLIGIWTECDDEGAFEWKPISLKMRIMPVDNVDIPALLEELEACNIVKKYTVDGRHYGAVRNFCRYQRPKYPKSLYPMPAELRSYVASREAIGGIDRVEGGGVPRNAEIPPQMERSGEEDGEERREEKKKDSDSPTSSRRKRGPYVFEAGCIKLNKKSYDQWKLHYKNINLDAELESLADWAGQQQNWFSAVAGALAKRDRNMLARQQDAAKSQGPPGPLWDPGL